MNCGIVNCAELHNKIVRHGWHATSAPFVPFWEKHLECQERMSNSLGADVIEFYKQALVPAGSVSAEDPYQNFFYYIQGLALPWEDARAGDESLGKSTRVITFYLATKVSGNQQGGIILDQETGQASVQTDLFSIETKSMVWQPLSTILTTYLNLIDSGKITAANHKNASENIRPGEIEPQYPWKYHSYSQEILARTLGAYHDLIAAIEAARDVEEDQEHELTVYLSTHFNLDAASFPKDCFARSFLTAARRPRGPKRIRFIAPGIELPSTTSIREQPFKAVAKKNRFASVVLGISSIEIGEAGDPLYPPFLLFPGEGSRPKSEGDGEGAVFVAPFDELEECPVGLWLDRAEPWSGRGGEDEAVIVPFEHSWTASSLSGVGTRMSLFAVFEQWTEMIREGKWDVDERGVIGGIELLRQDKCCVREPRGRSRFRDTTHSV